MIQVVTCGYLLLSFGKLDFFNHLRMSVQRQHWNGTYFGHPANKLFGAFLKIFALNPVVLCEDDERKGERDF